MATCIVCFGSAAAQAQTAAPPPPPLSSAAASQSPPNEFGRQGQIAIDGLFSFSVVHHTSAPPEGESTTSNGLSLAPGLAYFVTDGLSLHGAVSYAHASASSGGTDVTINGYGLQVGVGYAISVNYAASFWPHLLLGLAFTDIDLGGTTGTGKLTIVQAFAPLLFHPATHFFIGGGPAFRHDLTSSVSVSGMSMDTSKTTDIGVQSVIGGWF